MDRNIYSKIIDEIASGKSLFLETKFTGKEGMLVSDLSRRIIPFAADGIDCKSSNTAPASIFPTLTGENGRSVYLEPLTPKERLIILGCGHIALPLCEFAAKTGFEVTMLDDRPSFADPSRFPEAAEVLCDGFSEGIRKLNVTKSDYVVVITRGHRHDDVCLRALLSDGNYPAYLGMIGSKRRVRGLLNLLEEEGLDPKLLSRICTPIGLSIGAATPQEIAVSILSELIAYKRLPEKRMNPANGSDLDPDVIRHLAEDENDKAVVTVLATIGSTPRSAGAKMTVDRLGRIVGSIGGGCSEGAVIRDALGIIGTGRYQTKTIDMTGDVAEDEGMVCGGIMEVLIEDGSVPVDFSKK